MQKIEFAKELEEVKSRLPMSLIPLYLKVWPNAKLSRLKNTVAGKIYDEEILGNLKTLASKLEAIK
jgi:hypothetical protein|tara:strand:- start:17 stop:214 length:198 start_codon:yes stop_codon:yes gene_type:complete